MRATRAALVGVGGAADPYPHMFAALRERDYALAAVEIFMKEMTPEGIRNTGLIPRNVANRILMKNAARVDAFKLDPDMIEWRVDLTVSEEGRGQRTRSCR